MAIVIDACVLRSASSSEKPLPSNCRAMLEAVRDNAVSVAVCSTLNQEWRKHRSRYASMWMVAMYSRRLVRSVNDFSGRADAVDHAIARLPERSREAAEKDAHLLKSALDNSKIVVSSELNCRAAFVEASVHYGEIGRVGWVDPADGQNAVDAATSRAPMPEHWCLKP